MCFEKEKHMVFVYDKLIRYVLNIIYESLFTNVK